MSGNMKILLIEEPICYQPEEKSSGNLMMISDNLHVLQPKVKDIESIADILPKYIRNKGSITGWFYSASFSPLLSTQKSQQDYIKSPKVFKNKGSGLY